MKNFKFISFLTLGLLVSVSCEQELIVAEPPVVVTPEPITGTPGSADFSKFIAIGNSFVAGVQGGALFTDGQNNSLPAIMAKQFAVSGVGGGVFNQPTINATLGYNLFITQPILTDPTKPVLGRMLLQGASPKPTPQAYAVGNLEALPNPTLNPGFIFTGGKSTLNNFGVPAIVLGQALITQTGAWAGAGVDPRFSPFYGRLQAPPGTGTTLVGDAAAAGGTFFMFWLGLDDFFLYAAFGGDPTKAPLTPASGAGANGFDLQYGGAIGALLGSNPNLKGVVGNFPNIFVTPHFTSVPWNAIVLDGTKASAANAGYAAYNAGLANPGFALTAEEITKRTIAFKEGANGILIEDETLTNLTGFGLPSVRHATSADIFPLAAGTVLGIEATPGNPATVWGVTKGLTDQYALIPSEITAINNARIAYNATVAATVAANSSRLALADIDAALNTLVTNKAAVVNGVTITPNINPPTGMYSEDGIHPNSRGYAYLSHTFISAINAKFGATVPLTDVGLYSATGLPIP